MKEAIIARDKKEQELGTEVSSVEKKAESIVILNDEDFRIAGEATKEVKRIQKQVEDYWEPIYRPAYESYKSINEHKKAMLDPLKNAEKILKDKISKYSIRKEMERRAQEERMRKLAAEEAEKKLLEAAEAEKNGDSEALEYAMSEAEAYEGLSITGTVSANKPKADGVSISKSWEITELDITKIPLEFNGVYLLKIDESAIKKLIRESKGNIIIPGVKFKETETVSVRTA